MKVFGIIGISIGFIITLFSLIFYLSGDGSLGIFFVESSIGLVVIISGVRMYRYEGEDASNSSEETRE